MTIGAESERERGKRRYQRVLFDGIADRYEVSRPGYPAHVVEFVIATAGLCPRAAVLEVGCGTGQLTEPLAAVSPAAAGPGPGPDMRGRPRLNALMTECPVRHISPAGPGDAVDPASAELLWQSCRWVASGDTTLFPGPALPMMVCTPAARGTRPRRDGGRRIRASNPDSGAEFGDHEDFDPVFGGANPSRS